jgi:uncharacterized membrane protein (DUF373 family)
MFPNDTLAGESRDTASIPARPPTGPLTNPPAVVTALPELQVVEGAHRQLAPVREESPITMQRVGAIAYSAVGAITAIIAGLAIIVSLIWFIGDLHAVGATSIPANVIDHSAYIRNEYITAALNFLANLVLVLVLIEIFSAITTFVRTRRATARPIILVPLYIVMRAIVLLGSELLLNPPDATNTPTFILVLAEMGAFALVGLALSVALAALRETTPKEEAKPASPRRNDYGNSPG